MATAILFIGWDRPHVGMEDKAFGFLTTEGFEALKKFQGKHFERMEPFALTAHGGDLNGGILLFGERAKLDEMRRTDEFEAFSGRMSRLFSRYGVVPGLNFEGLQSAMQRMMKLKT
jgi:hypothetical protein